MTAPARPPQRPDLEEAIRLATAVESQPPGVGKVAAVGELLGFARTGVVDIARYALAQERRAEEAEARLAMFSDEVARLDGVWQEMVRERDAAVARIRALEKTIDLINIEAIRRVRAALASATKGG